MASKFLVFHMLLALAILSAVQLEAAGGALPVIHFINAVTDKKLPPIVIGFQVGDSVKGLAKLSSGQEYKINVDVKTVYEGIAGFGNEKSAIFSAYDPARDKGNADIYWKGDEDGISISYDRTNYKKVASWVE